jgi:hypothetical protein
MPQGRYFHAAEIVPARQEIYVLGGLSQQSPGLGSGHCSSSVLRDFWQFNLKAQRWEQVSPAVQPPALAGHTLTLRRHATGAGSLILIGGLGPCSGMLEDVWEFGLDSRTWIKMHTNGPGPTGKTAAFLG